MNWSNKDTKIVVYVSSSIYNQTIKSGMITKTIVMYRKMDVELSLTKRTHRIMINFLFIG